MVLSATEGTYLLRPLGKTASWLPSLFMRVAGRARKQREAKAKVDAAPIISDRPVELELEGKGTAKEALAK